MACLILFTDGSCLGNGKEDSSKSHGGIGIYHEPNSKFNISETFEGKQTNQTAELMAIIRALEITKEIKEYESLEIKSDSTYAISGITQWMKNWKRNNWRRKVQGQDADVANLELWKRLDELISSHPLKEKITWTKVSGHAGVKGNESADKLAVKASKESMKKKTHSKPKKTKKKDKEDEEKEPEAKRRKI